MDRLPRFRALGPFEARNSDGEAIDFGHRKVRALLVYLAVERGRPQSREHLATLLWARTGEDRARHNLRQALSKLRVLFPDLIDTPGDGVALNARACLIDLVTFEDLARAEEPDDLQRALDLYRGELLEGYNSTESDFQDWLEIARTRLRKLACNVAGRLTAVLRERGRLVDAIEVLNRVLRFDQANESAHRDLMELLARTGQRSDALRQYRECAAALARELGAEPGPETKQLAAEIRQGGSIPPGVAAAATTEPAAAPGGEQLRETVTILLADAARKDHAGEDLEGRRRILDPYLEVLSGSVGEHRGRVVQQEGVALVAQFAEPVDALTCARSVQRKLSEANNDLNEAARVHFRIGIHSGSVTRDGGGISGVGI
ncbi:MAG: hypothetical protein LJE70_19105, partial [Chromatiaceae bacterium]|nr:hypothetical protein [Chromatiaceae bacterium]